MYETQAPHFAHSCRLLLQSSSWSSGHDARAPEVSCSTDSIRPQHPTWSLRHSVSPGSAFVRSAPMNNGPRPWTSLEARFRGTDGGISKRSTVRTYVVNCP
ncbi:hypothetical protein BD310DRAFT_508370 [Dichomitus squalens]|uniref:Uncharacterized protein n=1 Tax=Dichomitus squalens TaxID=114155 RepID=A0A4Q9PTX1_9APHY|nr:hypothetical protein BD310DRAFT_508370 [Dichomitus squalens]